MRRSWLLKACLSTQRNRSSLIYVQNELYIQAVASSFVIAELMHFRSVVWSLQGRNEGRSKHKVPFLYLGQQEPYCGNLDYVIWYVSCDEQSFRVINPAFQIPSLTASLLVDNVTHTDARFKSVSNNDKLLLFQSHMRSAIESPKHYRDFSVHGWTWNDGISCGIWGRSWFRETHEFSWMYVLACFNEIGNGSQVNNTVRALLRALSLKWTASICRASRIRGWRCGYGEFISKTMFFSADRPHIYVWLPSLSLSLSLSLCLS